MHDLRHLVAQLALVVDNAARHRHRPDFIDDAIATIESSVKRMSSLMEVLRAGVVDSPERHVDLRDATLEAISRCAYRLPGPLIEAEAPSAVVMGNRERLIQALEHLIRNAQEATTPDGAVSVRLMTSGVAALLEIEDDGVGMEPEFVRSKLFKPFDTTKGDRGMGLGAYEAREIIRKQGGSMTVDSTPGGGTRILVELPLAPPSALIAGR
jgi:putative PEP-CTERM system histidine kinase